LLRLVTDFQLLARNGFPAGQFGATEGGGAFDGLDGLEEGGGGFFVFSGDAEGAAVEDEAFGIVGAGGGVVGEVAEGVGVIGVGEGYGAEFSPDFMGGDFGIEFGGAFEEGTGFFVAAFLMAEEAAELVEIFGLAFVDFEGAAEALFGFGGEAALDVDEAELIVGVGVVGVDGGEFELAFEVLAVGEAGAEGADVGIETLPEEEEEPGGGEHVEEVAGAGEEGAGYTCGD
jgi:hypothetical protein